MMQPFIWKTSLATLMLWLVTWLMMPVAVALTQIQLTDLSYHSCPEQLAEGAVSSGSAFPANCFIVTGTAINTSGKPVYNADVFGRIYDANQNPAMQNRNRLGSIDEVPPGQSTFEIQISVPANQPTPLHLEKFKASGFTGVVRR